MVQVLRRFADVEVDVERLRPFMQKGFPWHTPDQINPPMRPAQDWWDALLPLFEGAFVACQLPQKQARDLAAKVRFVYTDVADWRLYEDTKEVLNDLLEEGRKHAILSNHVPELPSLVEGLGLGSMIACIVNSAETGFEKPHPLAFRAALTALDHPHEVWMIGDSVDADILGAEAVGLRAILVRRKDVRARYHAQGLQGVRKFLG